MPAWLNHTNARWLALISTGSVMKLNNVVEANKMIPKSISCGKVCNGASAAGADFLPTSASPQPLAEGVFS